MAEHHQNLAIEHCVFEWNIVNLICRKLNATITSPRFAMDTCSPIFWNLELREVEAPKARSTSLYLLSNSVSESKFRLYVKFRVSSNDDTIFEESVKGKNGGTLNVSLPSNLLRNEVRVTCDAYILFDGIGKSPSRTTTHQDGLRRLSNDLLNLRHQVDFNDVVVKLPEKEIPANRTVLSARSPFFRKIFQESVSVCVLKAEVLVMEKILDFLYSGDFRAMLSSEDVFPHDLHKCATKIDLKDVRNAFSPTIIRGQSVFEAHSCTYTWRIEDFGLAESDTHKIPVVSPLFGVGGTKWNLKLFKKSKDLPEHMGAYVYLASPVDVRDLTLQISLLDREGEPQYTHRTSESVKSYGRCGFPAFVKRDSILPANSKTSNFDESITVRCEMALPTGKSPMTRSEITSCEATSLTGKTNAVANLSKHIGGLLATGYLSDITFVLKGGVQVKSHRFILAARSSVFEKLVNGEPLRDLKLKDIDEKSFTALLNYIYCGSIESNCLESLLQTACLAERFKINELEKTCFEMIESRFQVEMVLKGLATAHLNDSVLVKAALVKYVCCHVSQVIGCEVWATFAKSQPECVREIFQTLENSYKSSVRL